MDSFEIHTDADEFMMLFIVKQLLPDKNNPKQQPEPL